MDWIKDLLIKYGLGTKPAEVLSGGIIASLIILASILSYIIVKSFFLKIIIRFVKKNKFEWDDALLDRKVFHKLSLIVPALVIYSMASIFTNYYDLIQRLVLAYILIVVIFVINAVLDSVDDIYRKYPISKVRPIKGFLQVVKIVLSIILGIVIVAYLMGKSPIILLSGIGALTAVFSFIFKDSILGLVAGIQLTSNDMLRIGDWIEMANYGADGTVIDITLTTVKVRNFDMTYVTVPAYSLMSNSFKNWRGMSEAGGRRIKRSIYIDVKSIKFCTEEMIEKYKKINFLKEYIKSKEKEIEQYNAKNKINSNNPVNRRNLTNIGTFRIYIENYIKNHPKIHSNMIQMVRQLAPGEHGLPLEIYAFTNDTNWVNFERAQSDIFDHILAVAKEFELRVFQNPSGFDLEQIKLPVPNQ
ncbi:MAG: mechanosensitive ion channel [Clostridiaceae bacterium]|jgi:miniconductance mechanosensitive channel|nr:mechanosensitive ion channel [Clostridiaceae bacterium]